MKGLRQGLLTLALVGLAFQGLRLRALLGLVGLESFVGQADLAEAHVWTPHEFTSGEAADTAEVNANFSERAHALNLPVPSSFCLIPLVIMTGSGTSFCPDNGNELYRIGARTPH